MRFVTGNYSAMGPPSVPGVDLVGQCRDFTSPTTLQSHHSSALGVVSARLPLAWKSCSIYAWLHLADVRDARGPPLLAAAGVACNVSACGIKPRWTCLIRGGTERL